MEPKDFLQTVVVTRIARSPALGTFESRVSGSEDGVAGAGFESGSNAVFSSNWRKFDNSGISTVANGFASAGFAAWRIDGNERKANKKSNEQRVSWTGERNYVFLKNAGSPVEACVTLLEQTKLVRGGKTDRAFLMIQAWEVGQCSAEAL